MRFAKFLLCAVMAIGAGITGGSGGCSDDDRLGVDRVH